MIDRAEFIRALWGRTGWSHDRIAESLSCPLADVSAALGNY